MENSVKANTIVVTRKLPDSDKYEETLVPVSSIIKANRDATDTFTYLRVDVDGRRFNWHVTETPRQIDEMANRGLAPIGG